MKHITVPQIQILWHEMAQNSTQLEAFV